RAGVCLVEMLDPVSDDPGKGEFDALGVFQHFYVVTDFIQSLPKLYCNFTRTRRAFVENPKNLLTKGVSKGFPDALINDLTPGAWEPPLVRCIPLCWH